MLDLHIHTTASDGSLTPSQVVKRAKDRGFSLIAITDHDTMSGVAEALEAGKKYNVEVIPGVEISSGIEIEVHLLGYGIAPDNAEVNALLEDMRRARIERLDRVIENLRSLGISITKEEVMREAVGAVGRPHIARVLIRHGVVPDVQTAFREYIGVGAKAYAERRKLSCEQVISCIRKAGGVPVLAHGGLLKISEVELNELVDHMVRAGLMGLECYHSSHDLNKERMLREMAARRGLLVTGGSDFHGAPKPTVELGDGLERWDDRQACRGRFLRALEEARRDLQRQG